MSTKKTVISRSQSKSPKRKVTGLKKTKVAVKEPVSVLVNKGPQSAIKLYTKPTKSQFNTITTVSRSKSKDKIDKDMTRQSSGILKDAKQNRNTMIKKFNIVNDTFIEAYPIKVRIQEESTTPKKSKEKPKEIESPVIRKKP